ncbi:MAG: hypothetical protein JF564_00070 [Sphingomonas sp.]|nr:hypothetical protein [Sphingomonas sp.]
MFEQARAVLSGAVGQTMPWSRRTKIAHEATRAVALSIIGEEIPIDRITRAHCRDLIDVLQRIPRSASKRFPRLSPREAADEMGPKCDPLDRMSVANINAYLNKLGTFFNWAELDELIARNPAKGMRLADAVRKKDKRHPFSPKQLQTIFNAPLYRGCADDGFGYAKNGSARPKGTRFWVPLLGLYTGMRLNEICQLETTDVVLVDGILCISTICSHTTGSIQTQGKPRSK